MSAAPHFQHSVRTAVVAQRSEVQFRRVISTHSGLRLHAAVVAFCALSWAFLSPSSALILNGCLVSVAYACLGVKEARRGLLWLTPLSVFFFFYGLEMGPATVYVGYGLRANPWLPFARWMIPAEDLAAGYLLSLLGMFAMHIGLEVLCPPRGTSIAPSDPRQKFPFITVTLLWLLSVISIYRPLSVIPLGAFAIIFQYGGIAALLPFAFASSRQLGISRASHAMIFGLGTCGLVAASAATQNSSKMMIVVAFLPVAAFLIRLKRYRNKLPIVAAAGLLLYLGLIAPAINQSRNIPKTVGMTSWDRVVQAAEFDSILAGSEPASQFLSDQFGNLMGRMFEAPSSTGYLVGEVRRTGFQLGGTLRVLEYAFIPRIIWPEKPVVSRGAWFTSYIGMASSPEEATSSTGMTAFGDWYWNFGLAGELLGMFLIGLLEGGLWRLAGSDPLFDPIRMLLYVTVIMDVVMLPEASTVIVACVALYVMFSGFVLFRRIAMNRSTRFSVLNRPSTQSYEFDRRLIR